jgi:hypothetical protein
MSEEFIDTSIDQRDGKDGQSGQDTRHRARLQTNGSPTFLTGAPISMAGISIINQVGQSIILHLK